MATRGLPRISAAIIERIAFVRRIRTPRLRAVILVLAGLLAAGGAGAAIIVVNDSSDTLHSLGCATSGSGACTLRDAITFANAHAGPDEIDFAIFGSGVHTITLDSDLPTIAGDLTIDGYTQPGSSRNNNGPGLGDNAVLSIELNGNGMGCFAIGGVNTTIRGLVINRCGGYGVGTSFINSFGPIAIEGNFIGTDPTGMLALPNATGISGGTSGESYGGDFVVGGATPAARNLISGNTGAGVVFSPVVIGGPSVVVQNNQIGTTAAGTAALANGGSGIDFVLGIPVEISDNVVAGNSAQGITLRELDFSSVVGVHGNFIGTDVSGAFPLGNHSSGIRVFENGDSPSAIVISGNTIAYNGVDDSIGGGIVYFSGSHHWYTSDPKILSNSIFENTSDGSLPGRGLGIDLFGPGPNGNSPCDIPEEGQLPQNPPALTTALADGSTITIKGMLNTRAPEGGPGIWRIEFFASPTCDPSGHGEGRTFLGSTDVAERCDAEFDVSLPPAVPVGQFITATATELSTSEFSPCILLQSAASVTVVNRLVSLTALTTRLGTIGFLGAGIEMDAMTIRATFKNTSATSIGTPFFVVTEVSGGNFLANADGGGVGGRLTPNVGGDLILAPGESFTTEFVVGLRSREPFRFFVDLWGETAP